MEYVSMPTRLSVGQWCKENTQQKKKKRRKRNKNRKSSHCPGATARLLSIGYMGLLSHISLPISSLKPSSNREGHQTLNFSIQTLPYIANS